MSTSEKMIQKGGDSDTTSTEMLTKTNCVTRDSLPITNGVSRANGVSSTSSPDLTSRESSIVEDGEQEFTDLNHLDGYSDDSVTASGAAINSNSLSENQMSLGSVEPLAVTSSLTSTGAANQAFNHIPPENVPQHNHLSSESAPHNHLSPENVPHNHLSQETVPHNHLQAENVPQEYVADSSHTFHQDHVTYMPQNIHNQMAMKPGHMTVTGQGQVLMTSQGHLSVSAPSAGSAPISHGMHPASQGAMQSSPHSDSSSPSTHSPQGETNSPSPNASNGGHAGHQHVVHVHINPGETFSVRVGDQLQNIQGPATVRMVSNNGPPLPMPMHVPPGHMVQQIVDENGILTHVILSPQPHNMMGGSPMTGGPTNAPQYFPPYGGYPPQYPSPGHHHSHHGGGGTRPTTHVPHQHGTPPPSSCSSHGNHGNHGPVHSQGPSTPSNAMDNGSRPTRARLRKKHIQRQEENYYRDRPPQPKNRPKSSKGMNGDVSHNNSITCTGMTPCSEVNPELEEERRVIQQQLSSMPSPKVTEIESRSALIQLSPPDYDTKEYDIDPGDFRYELSLCEKERNGKYKLVYSGDCTEITLKDLKPATEYHLKVCTILDDLRGTPTEAISFKTTQCEPDQPQPPKLVQKTKTSLQLKWSGPCENGSKISAFILESEQGEGTGSFSEVFNGLQKQYRVAKLSASTKYTFRLAAINGIGKSEYSESVTYCTSGSAPSQPDPPMLSEVYVTEFVISWIKRPNDDEFQLQLEDEASGHGFMPVYNGPLLSHRISNLRRNKEYRFRLAAKNDEGLSKWSDIVHYKTLPARPEPPGKPQIKGKIHAHVFKITWDPPRDDGGSEITKYIVELDDGKGYETMYEGTEREHTCDRLTPGHTYRVKVAACSAGGRSEFSDVCIATTQAVPPGQCTVPKLQGKPKATSLHLRWAYPEYNGGAIVTEFAAQMISPDNNSRECYKGRDLDCIVAGLSPGRPYLFQVRAFNRAGGGPWSEPLEVVSGAGVPDPPKNPLINCRSAHSAVISWEGPVNNGATITDYRLEWQTRSDADFSQIYYGANTNYEVKGLSPNTLYSFRVQAVNSAGAGLYSPVSTCVTPPSSPSTVLSIRASPSATNVLLQWKEPHNNGSEIYAYNIDIGSGQLLSISAVTEYTIEELTPETTYKVRVQAVNGIGVGPFSSPVKFTTRALPPSPPRLECMAVAPNSLKLKWGDGRNVDLVTYTLEMDREDGNFQEVYKGQAFTCKVNRLSELANYDFRIYASNDAGCGPYSDTYTFTTTKAPPPALRAPRVEDVSLTSCCVEWTGCRPMGFDTIVYQLQLQSKDHEYRQVYRGSASSFTLENLQPKSDYTVRVCAIRVSSDSTELYGAYSPGHSFCTASPEPVKPVLSNTSDSQVVESKQWTDQQLAAILLTGVMVLAILIAFVAQQFI